MAAMRAVPATAGLSDLKNCMLGCLFPYPAGCRECGPVAASEQKRCQDNDVDDNNRKWQQRNGKEKSTAIEGKRSLVVNTPNEETIADKRTIGQ
jgi:hypothetical protein